jgi:C1A family cysteine protease
MYKMGWLPDYPDFRDYTPEHENIAPMLKKVKLQETKLGELPSSVDLRRFCSPIEDQGNLGSCTAQAAAAVVEYYEKRAFGKYIDASRLFIYKTTRNLLGLTGDTGAYLRTTMAALVLFGAPPEKYWPYTDKYPDFDKEPPAFCYAFAQNYQAIRYCKLDPPDISTDKLLTRIKLFLRYGFPSMFGFVVYDSISQAEDTGKIPYPCQGERFLGGHAVVAVGYDDNLKIKNIDCDRETKGALLIRNSWGINWGEAGYGWLPYEYVLSGLAIDFWTLLKSEWIDTGKFE